MPVAGASWSSIFPTDVNGNSPSRPPAMDPVRARYAALRPAANRPDGVTYQAVPVSGRYSKNQSQCASTITLNQKQNFSFYYYFTNRREFPALL